LSSRTVVFTDRCRLVALPLERLRTVLLSVLGDHDCGGELSVAFVDDESIAEIHARFLGKDGPTDVISFPLDEESDPKNQNSEGPFGEVVVSCETALREARSRSLAAESEVALYAIHGTLHLLGYGDHVEEERSEMRRQERHYLRIFEELSPSVDGRSS